MKILTRTSPPPHPEVVISPLDPSGSSPLSRGDEPAPPHQPERTRPDPDISAEGETSVYRNLLRCSFKVPTD